ncbi:hypothetical protein D1AOALGA4SA_4613 [Olavius algarvensis Delta 1 endosymbiont]|nr:hypothetical protein D1AOALGA4SA_4613 [Olavius algarvensis Delta 1 endosymbiont]
MIERSDSLILVILGILDHFSHSIILLHQSKKQETDVKIRIYLQFKG